MGVTQDNFKGYGGEYRDMNRKSQNQVPPSVDLADSKHEYKKKIYWSSQRIRTILPYIPEEVKKDQKDGKSTVLSSSRNRLRVWDFDPGVQRPKGVDTICRADEQSESATDEQDWEALGGEQYDIQLFVQDRIAKL